MIHSYLHFNEKTGKCSSVAGINPVPKRGDFDHCRDVKHKMNGCVQMKLVREISVNQDAIPKGSESYKAVSSTF